MCTQGSEIHAGIGIWRLVYLFCLLKNTSFAAIPVMGIEIFYSLGNKHDEQCPDLMF